MFFFPTKLNSVTNYLIKSYNLSCYYIVFYPIRTNMTQNVFGIYAMQGIKKTFDNSQNILCYARDFQSTITLEKSHTAIKKEISKSNLYE